MQPMLKMSIHPDWDEIDGVRTRSADFLRARGLAEHVVDALAMVTCELTENAVKYGHFQGRERAIDVSVSVEPETVTVEVKSPVRDESEPDLGRLDQMIQWIRGHQDPFEAYLARLKEVSSQSLGSTESGLGLVRIAYEGQSVLDFYVDDRNVLAVSAVYQLGSAEQRPLAPSLNDAEQR